ncbi:ATP-dependent RNA helicase ddx51, partial [Boothiomyces sp. JEL0866]
MGKKRKVEKDITEEILEKQIAEPFVKEPTVDSELQKVNQDVPESKELLDFKITHYKPLPISSTQGLPNWLKNPIEISPFYDQTNDNAIDNPKWKLSAFLKQRLLELGYTNWFPVQEHLIPRLYSSRYNRLSFPGDVCVSASTGSGKTLAYAVPIIEALIDR